MFEFALSRGQATNFWANLQLARRKSQKLLATAADAVRMILFVRRNLSRTNHIDLALLKC
jgi:hypothetical protein